MIFLVVWSICCSKILAYRISDLTATSQSTFASQASSWSISNPYGGTSQEYSFCNGVNMVGGYSIAQSNSSTISKTFTGLPAHSVVYLQFTAYGLGSWDGQALYVVVNSNNRSFNLPALNSCNQICLSCSTYSGGAAGGWC